MIEPWGISGKAINFWNAISDLFTCSAELDTFRGDSKLW